LTISAGAVDLGFRDIPQEVEKSFAAPTELRENVTYGC
jgi:hypothetical protein